MITAILQARTSSTRLPGKVLKPILGEPMLARQIERLRRAETIGRLVVATSDDASDDALEALCSDIGVDCFRGSLPDVLARFHGAAEKFAAEHVMRLTGDCPLADPGIVDATARFYLDGGFDYASNCRPPTLPDGLDVEVFTFAALAEAQAAAADPFEREHVVPYIIRRPERYRMGNWTYPEDLSGHRWTVDEPRDFRFVTEVYEALYPAKPDFGFQDVLRLLDERPELRAINDDIERNQGSKPNG